MEQDKEGARASRAREDGGEGAEAATKVDKKGSGGVKRRGAQGECRVSDGRIGAPHGGQSGRGAVGSNPHS